MASRIPVGAVAVQLLSLADARGLIHVTTSDRRAERLARALAGLAPELEVVVFPPWDCLPYDRASPSRDAMGRRTSALRKLLGKGGCPRVVITTPDAVLQRTPPRAAYTAPLQFAPGDAFHAGAVRSDLSRLGYLEDDRVDEAGEFAIRGEVVDIFPAGLAVPYRLEVPDGRVTAIRAFDPLTQRTLDDVELLLIDPASELVGEEVDRTPGAEHWLGEAYPKLETLLDVLPKARIQEDAGAPERGAAFLAQAAEAYRDRQRSDAAYPDAAAVRPVLPPASLYLNEAEWETLAAKRRLEAGAPVVEPTPAFATEPRPERAFVDSIADQLGAGRRVLLTAGAEGDLRTLTRRAARATSREPQPVKGWAEVLAAPAGALLSLSVELEAGFINADANVAVVTARDLLGSRARTADGDA